MKKLHAVSAPILAVLLASPVLTHALPGSQPRQGQAPKVALINPRVIREVKPVYTADAKRARIEGTVTIECVVQPDGSVRDVTVVKSLDRMFGLDDEAVKAAKQWRFVPGTRDGVAVPVLVTIELNFTLRDGGRADSPSGWPEAFLANSQTVSAGEDWTDEVSEDSGVRVRFFYPHGWTFRRGDSTTTWFSVQDGLRTLVVRRPEPGPAPIPDPLNALQLELLKETIIKSLEAHGSTALLQASGQVHSANQLWFWYTLRVPASDPVFRANAVVPLSDMFDDETVWTFMAAARGQGITVSCSVARPRSKSDADMDELVRQSGTQFRAMLERMTIEVR